MEGVMGTINRTPDRESLKSFELVRAEHGAWKVLDSYAARVAVATATSKEESFHIPFDKNGLQLFLRHFPAADSAGTKKVVLFIQGATFPSRLAAAFPFGGRSWMQDLLEGGFDAWALDFLGYGGSDRYPEMSQSTEDRPALGRAEISSQQIQQAMRFIIEHQAVQRASIIAHSWGTMAAGLFAGRYPELVDRLVFFAPIVGRPRAVQTQIYPAWLLVSLQQQWDRFVEDVPA
jgi:pimeloyl-ACP methyl ester carboxylesterase